jgi:hypothetical protein
MPRSREPGPVFGDLNGPRHLCLTRGSESTTKPLVYFRKTLLTLALLTVTSPLYAQATVDDWDGGYGQKGTRRSDVVFELKLAPALGWARGYPNEASKIDDPRYLTRTDAAFGYDYGFGLGGALRDWFTFVLGFEGLHVKRDGINVPGWAFTLRTEAYPLWSLGCPLYDLGVAFDFGIGALKMERNGAQVADGGSMGLVGLEVFHETWRIGGLALGPAAGYRQIWSSSLHANMTYAGLRAAFYTGP